MWLLTALQRILLLHKPLKVYYTNRLFYMFLCTVPRSLFSYRVITHNQTSMLLSVVRMWEVYRGCPHGPGDRWIYNKYTGRTATFNQLLEQARAYPRNQANACRRQRFIARSRPVASQDTSTILLWKLFSTLCFDESTFVHCLLQLWWNSNRIQDFIPLSEGIFMHSCSGQISTFYKRTQQKWLLLLIVMPHLIKLWGKAIEEYGRRETTGDRLEEGQFLSAGKEKED